MANERSLLFYVKAHSRRFVLALFFMAMVAAFTALFAVIIQPVMDELFVQSGGNLGGRGGMIRSFILDFFNITEDRLVIILPQLLFFSFLGQAVFTFLSLYLMKTLGLSVVRTIRDHLYRNLIYQSIDFLSRARTGDLVSRITNDIEKIKFAVSETLSVYVRESLTLVALLVVIFFQDVYMSMISLIIVPVAGGLLTAFGKKVKKRGIQSQETIGNLSTFLTETVTGNKIVKAYNMEEYEVEKFSKLNRAHYRIDSKIALVYSLSAPIMHTIGGLVAAVIFTVGGHRVASGGMSPGQFTSFLTALFLMYNPIKRLSQANNDYQQGKAGFERVLQVIQSKNPMLDRPGARSKGRVEGQIQFKNVYFSYQKDIPVIKNISFDVSPGELVALVGASGSGKTTLMNLLMRFYEQNSGEIVIDGTDSRDFTLKSLRENIGLVTQDVFLFNDTIRSNITYGCKDFDNGDIQSAADVARASEFIEKLPNKYDTMVGERGVFLSNGQRQRISIARAVLKKPPILIFDEATSSLDSESERLIQEAMVDVMKGRTTFVIAHRLSTIIEANKILVIEKGDIKESGNHAELLKKRGLYYSLYNLQFPEMDIIMEK
jgi:subfamily B ATP-binding cassette protein MsbA